MATLIRTNGILEDVKPENGTDFQLDELTKIVGCDLIEVVPTIDGRILIIDEEGKLGEPKPINVIASLFASIDPSDRIVGDALICDSEEVK